MHIIREHEDTLIVADVRSDGSVKVKYYELREYMELSAQEWDSLQAARIREIHRCQEKRGVNATQ